MNIEEKKLPQDDGLLSSVISTRLRLLRGEQSRRAFAKCLNIKESTLRNYEQGASVPNADFLVFLCRKLRISARWILLGEGPMSTGSAAGREEGYEQSATQAQHPAPENTPIFGLAAGDAEDWYCPSRLALNIPWADEHRNRSFFAVLTPGLEMEPEGIRPGNLAICDKNLSCAPGDVVYIKRKDGRASLRKLHAIEHDSLALQSWLSASGKSLQMSRLERLPVDDVACMAPVTFIKLKA